MVARETYNLRQMRKGAAVTHGSVAVTRKQTMQLSHVAGLKDQAMDIIARKIQEGAYGFPYEVSVSRSVRAGEEIYIGEVTGFRWNEDSGGLRTRRHRLTPDQAAEAVRLIHQAGEPGSRTILADAGDYIMDCSLAD